MCREKKRERRKILAGIQVSVGRAELDVEPVQEREKDRRAGSLVCCWDSLCLCGSLPCSVLLICTDSLFYRPGPGFCNTRHEGPLNSFEGTAIIWSRICSHQIGKIEQLQTVILCLVKPLATQSFELQLLHCQVQKRKMFLESTFSLRKSGYNFYEMRDETSSVCVIL